MKMALCELKIFDSVDNINWASLQFTPTVCLLATDQTINKDDLQSFVKNSLEVGSIFFMTWGKEAENLHNNIDNILEYNSNIDVATTYHEEKWDDVVSFFFRSAYCEPQNFRCLLFLDSRLHNRERLLNQVIEEFNKETNQPEKRLREVSEHSPTP